MAGQHKQTSRTKKQADRTPVRKEKAVGGRKANAKTLGRPSQAHILTLAFITKYRTGGEFAIQEAWELIGKPGGKVYTLKPEQSKLLADVTLNERSVHNWLNSVDKDSSADDKRVVARLAKTLELK